MISDIITVVNAIILSNLIPINNVGGIKISFIRIRGCISIYDCWVVISETEAKREVIREIIHTISAGNISNKMYSVRQCEDVIRPREGSVIVPTIGILNRRFSVNTNKIMFTHKVLKLTAIVTTTYEVDVKVSTY